MVQRPKVAIVGSVDEKREFEPPVKEAATARRACEELGRALAEAGWDIVVYSANPMFIEADVVRGYAPKATTDGSIEVPAPVGGVAFAEMSTRPGLFDERADPSNDWEVSYYRSLVDCDGVLMIGGKRSTLVTGLIALTMRVPILAVATFGGAARKVWDHLAKEPTDASEDDVASMAKNWRDDSARLLVAGLDRQRAARLDRERAEQQRVRNEARRAHIGVAVALVLLVLALAVISIAWGSQQGPGVSMAMLMGAPVLTAASGALIRTSLDAGRNWARAGALGAAAGFVTALLYVASQVLGAPDLLESDNPEAVRRLLFFVLPIGFVAGLTFDAVYAKLRGPDVSQAETLGKL